MMRRSQRLMAVLAAALLAGGAAAPFSVVAQEPAPSPERLSEEEIVEQILELQRRIETLIRQLSPAGREELQRRLAGAAPGAPEGAEAVETPEATAAVTPAATPTATSTATPTTTPAIAPAEPAAEAPERCDTLRPFDSNGDGLVNASDRAWRYLYLWNDGNGDGEVERSEVASAFDRGVRGISVRLDTFTRAKGADGLIRIRDYLIFDLRGSGFGDGDDAALAIDATSLSRGTGPQILDAAGEPVTGIQPFEKGWTVRDSAGRVRELRCR